MPTEVDLDAYFFRGQGNVANRDRLRRSDGRRANVTLCAVME